MDLDEADDDEEEEFEEEDDGKHSEGHSEECDSDD
jgi:hypothetical protein